MELKSWYLSLLLSLLVLAAGITGYWYIARKTTTSGRLVPINTTYTTRVAQGGWTRGITVHPQVVVIEYADLQCIACKAFNPIIDAAYNQLKTTDEFEYREYPLSAVDDKATLAASGAEAAGRQGKFWQMEELLYAQQDTWTAESPTDFQTTLSSYASQLGINVDQFDSDLTDPSLAKPIQADIAEGADVPVQGTPTITINGSIITPLPTSTTTLVNLINQAAHAAS